MYHSVTAFLKMGQLVASNENNGRPGRIRMSNVINKKDSECEHQKPLMETRRSGIVH